MNQSVHRSRIVASPPSQSAPSARSSWLRIEWVAFGLCFFLIGRVSGAGRGDDFFNGPRISTFKIHVDEPALAVLQKNDRSYVRATVTEGTNVLKDVGIHLKGMGSFQPFDKKPSFSVKFDKYVDGQRLHGLTKIMLNNGSQDDGTYLAELMATRMFRDAGVPAARVTHAFVEVNERALGLYVVIEAMNREFLRQYFRNTRGNLYEAYLQDIDQKLDQDGGTETSQADLKRFLEVCRLPDRSERWKRLPEVLDVDGYLSHLAVEMITSHTDGYAWNRNNYRLYHDPASDRFSFLAHGIDWGFAATGHPIRPQRNSSIVTKAVLETPEGQREYRERFRSLFDRVFQLSVLTNRVNAAVAKLQSAARNPNEAKQFEGFGVEMNKRLVARHKNIVGQLATPEPQPVRFATNGIALLSGWYPRKESGEAVQDQTRFDDRLTLHLRVMTNGTIASWRTKVLLTEGHYTLEGLARTAEVMVLTNAVKLGNGVGLRVSNGKRTNDFHGDQGWTPLKHEFEVKPGDDEKEMICEIRASRGEAWFDAGSLRLVRKP